MSDEIRKFPSLESNHSVGSHSQAIYHANLMLDFARCQRTQFHVRYFATMAVKLLQPVLMGEAADSRARSQRLQSVGEPGRGGAWS